jgi:hypothetical protein
MTGIRTSTPRTVIAVLVGAAVIEFGGLALGWWWVTAVVGLLVAAIAPGRAAVFALICGTLLGWAGALLWQSGSRLRDVADLVGAIALRARGMGWAVLAVTLAYAVLLALAGAWTGAAARRLVRDRTVDADEPEARPLSLVDSTGEEANTEEEQHV